MYTVIVFSDSYNKYLYVKNINHMAVANELEYENNEYQLEKEELVAFIDNLNDTEKKSILRYVNSIENKKNQATISEKKEGHAEYQLGMHPSRKCNLRCKYCFADESNDYLPKKEIKIDIAKKAIDYLVDDYGKNGVKYNIDIAGSGEPLLKLDFIKELSEYCYNKSNEIKKDIYISFPTNATLLTPEIADYLDHAPNILPGVSIDGNREHSENRVFVDGSETFEKAVQGAKNFKFKFGIAATITKHNQAVDEVYDYLYSELSNCDAISLQQVRNFEENNEYSFYAIDMDKMLQHYDIWNDKILQHLKERDYEYLFKLLRGGDHYGRYINVVMKKGVLLKHRCAAGGAVLSVDAEGNLFSCNVMNGEKDFYIGDIYHGVQKAECEKFVNVSTDTTDKCSSCWAAHVCGGECHVKSYLTHGDMYTPVDEICYMKKEQIKKAIALVGRINQLEADIVQRVKNFFGDSSTFDTSVWAADHLLNDNNINISYRDLNSMVTRTQNGVKLGDIASLIKRAGLDVKAIQMTDSSQIENLKTPAIGFMNHYHQFYRYVYINRVDKGDFVIKDMCEEEEFKISGEKFLNEVSNIFLVTGDK